MIEETVSAVTKALLDRGLIALIVSLMFNVAQGFAVWKLTSLCLRLYADIANGHQTALNHQIEATTTLTRMVEILRELTSTVDSIRQIATSNAETAKRIDMRDQLRSGGGS